MAVTIKDVLELDIMKSFKIVAGADGLSNVIAATEILDFEFLQEVKDYRTERTFEGNSIVLSSLLFAKDHPELILDAVKRLKELNVKALAYKPVFFKKLPEDALAYAEKNNFPILEFGHDEYFETIITSIKELVEKDQTADLTESLFDEMLKRKFSQEEADHARERINPLLRPLVVAVCIKFEDMNENDIREIVRLKRPDSRLESKSFVGKCRDTLMIILSQDERNLDRFRTLMEDILITYGLAGKKRCAGVSSSQNITAPFDQIIHQAYWTQKVAEVEGKEVEFYYNLGVYKLIISDINSSSITEYMENYLQPIFEEEDYDLLQTGIEYVLSKGDTMKTAERMFCHKNTIRYRIGKLQEKVDPQVNEKEFYQNLAMAIKIYLLKGRSSELFLEQKQ